MIVDLLMLVREKDLTMEGKLKSSANIFFKLYSENHDVWDRHEVTVAAKMRNLLYYLSNNTFSVFENSSLNGL
ncbi:unnamed protein product [Amoebophrya sp. A25]|nr:unnamed protein product [Amoebophrya sp. A25]|eukprot:GSA25T00010758001.1